MVEVQTAAATIGNAPFAIQPIAVDGPRPGALINQTNWTIYVTN